MIKKNNLVIFIVLLLAVTILNFTVKAFAVDKTQRIFGTDRYLTAIEISTVGWPAVTTGNVVLATGGDFPDALCAAPLAKLMDAPILLTEKLELSSQLQMELIRLGAKKVYIIGGQGVISLNIESQLKAMGIDYLRISGSDRYSTSIEIAKLLPANNEMVLATGVSFPDALSIAPIAAKKGMPIILSPKSYLSEDIRSYIKDKSIIKTYLIGGVGALEEKISDLVPNPERITGKDRYETNAAIISRFGEDMKLDFNNSFITTGENFPDALAGSALAAKLSTPIILVNKLLANSTLDFINSRISYVGGIKILGGEGVVAVSVVQGILPRIISINNIPAVTINQGEAYTLPSTVAAVMGDKNEISTTVIWNPSIADSSIPGQYTYIGSAAGYENKVNFSLTINATTAVISSISDIAYSINQRESFLLPSTVTAIMSDGSGVSAPVAWNPSTNDLSKPGQYLFTGIVNGYGSIVNLKLTINEAAGIKHPILGNEEATAKQLAAYLATVNLSPKISCTPFELAQMFLDEGRLEGVRGDIAFCQSIHETGWFCYGGQVLPEQNNYAGIGATNNSAVGKGAWFATPREGVRAQIQHLKGYASILPLTQVCVDPRYSLLVQYNLVGLAPNWEDLNGRWAVPGATYGQSIISLFNNLTFLNLP